MPSRHLIDPELAVMIENFPALNLDPASLKMMREMMGQMAVPVPDEPSVTKEEKFIPGPKGAPEVRVLVFKPKAAGKNRPGIVHVHGGGYVLGRAEMGDANNQNYAKEFGAVVVSVDYRLAPETPAPGSVEDCYVALKWLHDNAEALGVDRNRIAITGESAGGGLAAALTLLARDRKEVPVAFQHLVFPMLDDRTCIESDPSQFLGQFVWTRAANVFGWTSLLGHAPGAPDVSPYAAPARCEDLSGLPPTYIICGALDLFLEEDIDYARRMIRAGVPVEMHIYPGAPHAFMSLPTAQVAQNFNRDSMAALKRALVK